MISWLAGFEVEVWLFSWSECLIWNNNMDGGPVQVEIFQYFDRDSPLFRLHNLPPRQYSNEIFLSRMNLGTDLIRLMFWINKTFINILKFANDHSIIQINIFKLELY